MKKYRLKTREELEADPQITKDEEWSYTHEDYPDSIISEMFDANHVIEIEDLDPMDAEVIDGYNYYPWMLVEIEEKSIPKNNDQIFKVGDTCFSPMFGWGEVVDFKEGFMFPYEVKFENSEQNRTFTKDGRYILDDSCANTLFKNAWEAIEFIKTMERKL